MNQKRTMVFMDVDGTILPYDDNDAKMFLENLLRFQRLRNTIANIHLVSPTTITSMQKTINKFDKHIIKFNNNVYKTHYNESINQIAGGTAFYSKDMNIHDIVSGEEYNKIITPMDRKLSDDGNKKNYVNIIMTTLKNLDFPIYCGDGMNDIQAIEYIKSINGIILAPSDANMKVKKLANYIGKSQSLKGISEALGQLLLEKVVDLKDIQKDLEIS